MPTDLTTGVSDAVNMDDGQRELRLRLQHAVAGRFTVGDAIGHGATSFVFAARDLQHFDREVAVKVIRPEVAEAVGVARFRREMRLAAQLTHPHILPLLDWGDADGLLYYVMPRVAGESLRSRLQREQQLALDDAVRITRDVAAALQHAHAQGIAHRDVKPENILLADGQAILADFGLARVADPDRGESVTTTGIVVGTAAYMSPEQASGGPGDARSDQYALACVLYEMLAGDPPFHASTVQTLLARHRSDAVPHLTSVRPSLPAGVDEALQRALAKVPADRFANVAQLVQAVETAWTGASLAAMRSSAAATLPPVSLGRAAKWQRTALGGLAVAALGWWIFKSFDVLPGDRAPRLDANLLAVAPFDVFDPADSLWREGLMDMLSRSLDDAGPIRTSAPSTILKAWRGRADLASASELGRRLGAGLVLYGQFVRLDRDSVRVNVSLLHRVDGRRSEIEVRDAAIHPDRIADSLAVRVLQILQSNSIAAVQRSSLGSRSFQALKSFLQGEQYYRRNSFGLAKGLYENAIGLDSTFALAHRRMRGVLRAIAVEDDSLSLWHAERAGTLNRGLSRRDSLLVAADSLAAAAGRQLFIIDEANYGLLRRRLSTLEAAAAAYPDDPEVWLELAEAQHHIGTNLGITADKALDSFARSIQLDPNFTVGYFHAVELSLGTGDVEGARRYVDQYLTANPSDQRFALARGVLATDIATRETTLVRAMGFLGDTVRSTASLLRRFHDSTRVAERLYKLLAESAEPRHASVADIARTWLGVLRTYEGRLRSAHGVGDAAQTLRADEYNTLILLSMNGMLLDSTQRALFSRLPMSTSPVTWILATSWYGVQRDSAALRALIRQSEQAERTTQASTTQRSAIRYAGAAARAYVSLAGGDTESAIRQLRRLPDSLCSWVCLPERLATARLLRSTGRLAEAAQVLDRVVPSGAAHLIGEVFWAFERARLARDLGDQPTAVRWYRLVASAWAHADPEFQQAVAEAQDYIRRATLN